MATLQLVLAVLIFCSSRIFSQVGSLNVSSVYCPYFRNAPSLNAQDLVGSWLTVYTQPKTIDCFTLHVRATTDLEREQNIIKYGNFSGRVEWESCLLEVKSPLGKHFMQGSGSEAGLFENIILTRAESGDYKIEDQSADQWSIFGRRGSEVLVMRDCLGEAAAAFARAPYWPGAEALHAVLHRSGVAPLAQGRVLCEPRIQQAQVAPLSMSRYFSDKY